MRLQRFKRAGTLTEKRYRMLDTGYLMCDLRKCQGAPRPLGWE
jgi:hypothetical protein